MKKHKDLLVIGMVLIGLSVILHYVNYLMFHDLHHLMIFLVADIAFIPLEVFFVTVVIDRILEKREKAHFIEKLNMIVGLFFSEVGLDLLRMCANADEGLQEIRNHCEMDMTWEDEQFEAFAAKLKAHNHTVEPTRINVEALKELLDSQKTVLISLIANPSLLEHDSFSELLMAVMHLEEELNLRYDNGLSEFDLEHIAFDIERAYKHLGLEWIEYMRHLKVHFPYLYLTALITNPYTDKNRVESEKIYKKQMNA